MTDAFVFLLPAFTACVILTGIHAYLGMHVIQREIIFVDIALAQMAALGMSVAFLMGLDPQSEAGYFFAVGFTLVGALFFSSFRNKKVPQEAAIGVVFAVASAACILIADKIPHGSEHLKYILNGNILWVHWAHLAKTSVIYLALGIFHYRLRKQFFLISSDPAEAEKRGLSLRRWDFMFYLTFGLVITSSVQIAGVLLVFAFLIVPALIARMFASGIKSQLLLGWVLGVLVSLLGIWTSYHWDLPTGAAIVGCFGTAFGAALLIGLFLRPGSGLRR